MIMATEIYIIQEQRPPFQVGRRWENIVFVRNSWENVGGGRFICDFIRFSDTNPKFTSMTIAKLITSSGPNGHFPRAAYVALCPDHGECRYLMSSLRGMLLLALVKVSNTALNIVGKRIEAFIVVQCRSILAKDAVFIRLKENE